ncbi:hypothetical protein [Streptomyces sp. NPDC055912]|uniref:hypothetical protein n=1 Tax=unclassified Streptomyces TaxID=2593676 RepID=UPI0035D59ED9
MPCSCQKNKQQYEVVSATGKVVFTTASKPTADTVSKRYLDSTVRLAQSGSGVAK